MTDDSCYECRHNPQRILFVITDLDVGGAEKCCVQLATGLDRTRWQAAVCSLAPPGAMAERLERAGIPVYSLSMRRPWHALRALLQLTRLLLRTRPAIVHTFLFHANVIGRMAARLAGTLHVVSSIRVAERRHRYHLVVENLMCRLCDRVICVSRAVADFTQRQSHVPAMRLAVVPNAIDYAAPGESRGADRAVLGAPAPAIAALYVGRLDRQKGVDVLLRALARAQRRVPQLHLSLAGAGPEHAALVELARQLGVESRVHFLGWRHDVAELLRAADFFVIASRWEGMPNAVLEAMAAGLPVIATRVEGCSELVRDGETGRLIDVEDPDQLADAMVAFASDPAARRRFGENGQQLVRQEFSLEPMIARYQQLYDIVQSGG